MKECEHNWELVSICDCRGECKGHIGTDEFKKCSKCGIYNAELKLEIMTSPS